MNPLDYAIYAKNLVKKYDKAEKNAVDGIDIDVKPGEVYGFLGPNGAGKSTAIKMFCTTLFPTSGEIYVAGIDAIKKPNDVRKEIGVVFQNISLDENLTAEENLRTQAVLYDMAGFSLTYGMTNKMYKDRVKQVLELVELGDKGFAVVKTFSGGMKRRLDLAKALIHMPRVLFLDEPTTGLDPKSRKVVWQYLLELQKEKGFTIFLTTHYLEEAEVCDRISIVDNGKILETDTSDALKKKAGEEMLYLEPANKEAFEKELAQKGYTTKTAPGGDYIIGLKGKTAQSVLKDIDSELVEISIKKPTLDDVFIEMTGRKMD